VSPEDWQTVADRFGLGQLVAMPSYVARGFMGEIWRLNTTGGRWAVKLLFPWADFGSRPSDVAIQIAAAAGGVRLPHPVLTPDGDAVIDTTEHQVRVHEWVDVSSEPLTTPVSAEIAADAGHQLGLLHRLAIPPVAETDPWFIGAPAANEWSDLTKRATAAHAVWAPAFAAKRATITELSRHIAPASGRSVITCHRDFHPGNVFPSAADGKLVVLDWENAGGLEAERELGYALFAWSCGSGTFDPATAKALIGGYAAATGSEPILTPELFATAVATHLNILQAMADQALGGSEHAGFAEEELSHLLGHYLDDLLHLVSLPITDMIGPAHVTTVPPNTVPDNTVPPNTAPANTAESDTASADTASADTASADTASADTASADTASADTAPAG